ncbi:MAG: hypothetical protein ACREOO_11310 [bacterium]
MAKNISNPSTASSAHTPDQFARKISRADFLKQLFLLSGAALTACTPLRIALKTYPDHFDADHELKQRLLHAFAAAVIPGIALGAAHSTRMLTDDFYAFHSYCGFFAADLAHRSVKLYGDNDFDRLSIQQRTHVIQDGLQADATTARLYQAAIYMVQLSFYASIYDDKAGCALIDFHGANAGFPAADVCYRNRAIPLAHETTSDGNPP